MGGHWTIVREQQRVEMTLCAAPRIADTLEGYRISLQIRKLRPQAVDTYLRDLSLYVRFLGDEATVADVTQDSIEEFQATRTHLAPATSCKLLTTIRSYCRYCIRRKMRADDPTLEIERPEREETPPRALKTGELRKLDEALAVRIDSLPEWRQHTRMRDRLAVLVMLYCGLRISEAADVLWKDIKPDVRIGGPPTFIGLFCLRLCEGG